MGEKSPGAEDKGEGVRANQRNRLIRMVKRRSDTDALLDAMRAEGDWYWAAYGMKPVDPLLERCRPVMRAAFEDFLNDRARWADDVITAAEDGFRLNRLFDGERFVRDRADAVLKMGWLMAYYYPKDNPLSEAQCKRATALGILKNWDRRSPVKIEDDVVLGLAYLLNDLDPKEPRYDGPGVIFPRHVGLEGAMTELQRWFRVVVGREANAAGESPAQSANDEPGPPTDKPLAPLKKPKRSTQRGDGQAKLIAALTKHHKYADGSCLNLEPVGNNELARLAEVAKRTASAFFRKSFEGHDKYRALCNDTPRLVAAIKALNGEFQPRDFYNARTPDEVDRENE